MALWVFAAALALAPSFETLSEASVNWCVNSEPDFKLAAAAGSAEIEIELSGEHSAAPPFFDKLAACPATRLEAKIDDFDCLLV